MSFNAPDDSFDFQKWAVSKYNEVLTQINVSDDKGEIDPVRLNQILVRFSGNYAWAITMLEIHHNELKQVEAQYDVWSRRMFSKHQRLILEERGGGRAPGVEAVKARFASDPVDGDELQKFLTSIEDLRSKYELLRAFVRLFDRQASILQTLSSNMRSELFFTTGVQLNGDIASDRVLNKAERKLDQALSSHKEEEENATDGHEPMAD